MTDHRATPEQWDIMQDWADSGCAPENCILELRARVEALEAQRETEKAAILDIYERLDALKLNHESNWVRIVKLEEAKQPTVKESLTPPTGSLVERVAIASAKPCNETWDDQARAAIRVIAGELRAQCFVHAADWLEQEANR